MSQRVLVIGGSGMLGSDLCSEILARGHELEAPSSKDLDITDPSSIAEMAMSFVKRDWCINCAAYTAVDKAETEVQQATELNVLGPAYLANACGIAGMKFIHISTDFVFDGTSTEPYSENARTNPLGVYGRTKLEGEEAVQRSNQNAMVVRTSWLYGPNGNCFPKTMIRAWEAGKTLRVISDQTGCPTYTADLARVLVDMVEKNAYPGMYHACGTTATTWHEFAVQAITAWRDLKGSDRPVEIEPIPTEAYPTPAKRPKYSVLAMDNLDALGIQPMRELPTALVAFVRRLQRNQG